MKVLSLLGYFIFNKTYMMCAMVGVYITEGFKGIFSFQFLSHKTRGR